MVHVTVTDAIFTKVVAIMNISLQKQLKPSIEQTWISMKFEVQH
jgi:hypothetical protein